MSGSKQVAFCELSLASSLSRDERSTLVPCYANGSSTLFRSATSSSTTSTTTCCASISVSSLVSACSRERRRPLLQDHESRFAKQARCRMATSAILPTAEEHDVLLRAVVR
jgi:hypothetical protein